MNICVQGLWHLGSTTSACLAAEGFSVFGYDEDMTTIDGLSKGRAPLYEPELDTLIGQGLESNRLSFLSDREHAVANADVLWICYDTPVDEHDNADTAHVIQNICDSFRYLKDGAVVLISSQLPVGSIFQLEQIFQKAHPGRNVGFASSPENLRLGKAIDAFRFPDRIIIGTRDDRTSGILEPILSVFSGNLIWVSVESAELIKHSINAFLAVSITLTNEIASICEKVGADTSEVEAGLRSEPRIGKEAYVRAGSAFGGGTLARDVRFLNKIGKQRDISLPLLSSIIPSNMKHRLWLAQRTIETLGGNLAGKTVAVLGLSYKPHTNSIRRSVAIQTIEVLLDAGAMVKAHDPSVVDVRHELPQITQTDSAIAAINDADALVIATDWPEFRELDPATVVNAMNTPIVIDQNKHLSSEFASNPDINYVTFGAG